MITTCPSCGTPVQPGSVFCDNCGANLAGAQARPPQGMPPAPPPGGGMIPCSQCGNPNVPGAVFCENCGASLGPSSGQPQPGLPTILATEPPAAAQPPQPAWQQPVTPQQQPPAWQQPASPQPPMPPAGAMALTGRLVIVANGTSIAIPSGKPEAVIGREDPVSGVFPEIDMEPHDGLSHGVGRRHAKLSIQGGQVYLEDLNSVNHTHLRGQKLVPGQKYPLNDGDELVLGKMKLNYFKS